MGSWRPNSHATGNADRLRGGLRDLPRRRRVRRDRAARAQLLHRWPLQPRHRQPDRRRLPRMREVRAASSCMQKTPSHRSKTQRYTRALCAVGLSKRRLVPSSATYAQPAPSLRPRAALPASPAPRAASARRWVRAPPLSSSCVRRAPGRTPSALTAVRAATPVVRAPTSPSLAPTAQAPAWLVPWAPQAPPLVCNSARGARGGATII